MKNLYLSSIGCICALFIFCLFPTSNALAQDPADLDPQVELQPCPEPGCLEPWTNAFYNTVFTCPQPGGSVSCSVKITYRYRNNACGGLFQDLFIDGVTFNTANPNCNTFCTVQAVYQFAAEALLLNNPMNFTMPTQNGECISTFRVQSTACWGHDIWWKNRKTNVGFPATGGWWACLGNVCCVAPYRVCKRFGVLVVEKTGPSVATGTVDCINSDPEPQQYGDPVIGNCYSICE